MFIRTSKNITYRRTGSQGTITNQHLPIQSYLNGWWTAENSFSEMNGNGSKVIENNSKVYSMKNLVAQPRMFYPTMANRLYLNSKNAYNLPTYIKNGTNASVFFNGVNNGMHVGNLESTNINYACNGMVSDYEQSELGMTVYLVGYFINRQTANDYFFGMKYHANDSYYTSNSFNLYSKYVYVSSAWRLRLGYGMYDDYKIDMVFPTSVALISFGYSTIASSSNYYPFFVQINNNTVQQNNYYFSGTVQGFANGITLGSDFATSASYHGLMYFNELLIYNKYYHPSDTSSPSVQIKEYLRRKYNLW